MKLGFVTLAVAFVAASAVSTGALANPDVIKLRKELMQDNGAAITIAGKMAQGGMDFDADVAKASMATIAATGDHFSLLFPAGSLEGDTRAGPAIGTDRDGFVATAAKLKSDAEAAVAAIDADGLDGLKASIGAVGSNCQTCHQTYRSQ